MSHFVGWVDTSIKEEHAKPLLEVHFKLDAEKNILDYSSFYCFVSQPENIIDKQNVLILNAGNEAFDSQHTSQLIDKYISNQQSFLDSEYLENALILIDKVNNQLILMTDPIGLTQIYYAETKKGLVFGSSADHVLMHPEVNADISDQAVYDYVYFHHCPSPGTIYKGVNKLEGGQCLVYQDGKTETSYYWSPQFSESNHKTDQALSEELQHALTNSVRKSVDNADNTGAFLSGGLDSSSVAGALSQVFPNQAKTFSMGFPVEGYDETEYANIVVKHFNTQQHEYVITPEDTLNAIPDIAAYYDEPFGNSSALAALYCARLAKENGVSLLLGGDGGDEIFAGNERYAQQIIFDYYQKIPGFMGQSLDWGLNQIPGQLASMKLIHKAKRYIEQAKTPLPDRLQDYNFLHRHPGQEIFKDDYLNKVNPGQPLQLLRDAYQRPEQASSLNRMLAMDWKSTLHDNDLVKVNKMCEMAGVKVRYPLLGKELVEMSCRIPSQDKLSANALRKFYKKSMADFLPEAILNKSKHGFGLPFGIWLRDYQPLKELAYDSINSLKQRPYFRAEFLDHAVKMHQSVHAAYYGELIWILMMLELWFQGKK